MTGARQNTIKLNIPNQYINAFSQLLWAAYSQRNLLDVIARTVLINLLAHTHINYPAQEGQVISLC